VIVDSSVWIDYFNDTRSAETDRLASLPGSHAVLVGDLILAEVLQGFRSDSHFRAARRAIGAFETVSMVVRGWRSGRLRTTGGCERGV
jgi:hypothetical protein